MMVGLRNFHERREMIPDSNFWYGCPDKKSFHGLQNSVKAFYICLLLQFTSAES